MAFDGSKKTHIISPYSGNTPNVIILCEVSLETLWWHIYIKIWKFYKFLQTSNVLFNSIPAPNHNQQRLVINWFVSDLTWRHEPRRLFIRKFNQEMAVWPNKLYFIRLRGTKEGQECASLGHLESQYPQVKGRGRVEKLKKSRRGTTGGQKMHNRGT